MAHEIDGPKKQLLCIKNGVPVREAPEDCDCRNCSR